MITTKQPNVLAKAGKSNRMAVRKAAMEVPMAKKKLVQMAVMENLKAAMGSSMELEATADPSKAVAAGTATAAAMVVDKAPTKKTNTVVRTGVVRATTETAGNLLTEARLPIKDTVTALVIAGKEVAMATLLRESSSLLTCTEHPRDTWARAI